MQLDRQSVKDLPEFAFDFCRISVAAQEGYRKIKCEGECEMTLVNTLLPRAEFKSKKDLYLHELRDEVCKIMPAEGRLADVIPGINVSRFDSPQPGRYCFYKPMLAVVLQGEKRSVIAGHAADYGQGHYAVVCLDLLGIYHIENASKTKPFLSVSVDLDRKIIKDLLDEFPKLSYQDDEDPDAVNTAETSDELLDVLLRMLKLTDPDQADKDRSFYAPMYMRELHYLLLKSPQRQSLCSFCVGQGINSRIALTIAWLREHFKETFDIDTLAKKACMGVSTFHKHFKLVTSLSPVQFQKRLRLQEAERLMLIEGASVDAASMAVGYESSSQFSREYKRLFGLSPRDDIARKRKANSA